MKVASKSRAAATRRNVPASKRPPVPDHDLPILAADEIPARDADWKSLVEAGIEPALLIGGERRWQGRR